MPRVKRGTKRHNRRKKLLTLAKGYYLNKSKLYKFAKESVEKALVYAYRDRKVRKRDFRRLWIAQIISEVGDWFYMVALYAMLLEFTGRAELLGIAFVLQVLPQALTSPVAGVINDRLRRQRVMIFSDLARAVIVSCMLLVRSPQMIWLVYPLLALETAMWGLFEPARNAVM